jgi:hypothetical protein
LTDLTPAFGAPLSQKERGYVGVDIVWFAAADTKEI